MPFEKCEIRNEHVILMRQKLFPVAWSGIRNGRSHHAIVLRTFVGADVKKPIAMVDVVLVVLLAWEKDSECRCGPIGGKISKLGGIGCCDPKKDERPKRD